MDKNNSSASCNKDSSIYQNTWLGIAFVCHSVFYYIFYIPCAIVIFKKHLQLSCYKIMGALSIVDMCGLAGNGLIPGVWSILGTSMCQYYWVMKIVGAFANGTWITYCALCMTLSINRAFDMSDSVWYQKLFHGNKTLYWIVLSFCWGGVYVGAFMSPYATLIYHAGIGVLVFDPNDPNKLGAWMNLFTDSITPLVMGVSYYIVGNEMNNMTSLASNEQTQAHTDTINTKRRITITSILVCILAAISCCYPIVHALAGDQTWLLTLTAFFWQMTSGSNCLIYLLLNKKIREEVKGLMGCQTQTVTPLDIVSRIIQVKPGDQIEQRK